MSPVADPLLAPLHRLDARPAVSVAGRGLTYRELRAAAAAVARRLRGAERAAVWAEPALETCAAVVGALAAGVPLVPLNPRLGEAELAHVLSDSAPDVVLRPADVDLRARGGTLPDTVPDPEATRFNFTADIGGAVKFVFAARRALMVGYKYHHLSNGGLGGVNPGANAHVFYLGFIHQRR
jgi:malonyl-CoA/methylmalonyl-CoA synthetase